ncbi:SRPBCC family protein [Aequorivita marina]|uniref:SRPBCC family protein n=1 Tax=Aequorivita marina TaxID=3073654 RepID=UPI00287604EF|nr:GyrI-like domain-containing protein [Aequorivita sp. S2608]MDS1299294.1 GyrI-like domain-containing protein [Aequorivita sp. S2608]
MKIIKYLLFLILIIIIGSAIYLGTKDGTYDLQDTTVINAPPEVVFNKVNNFKSWETWNPWKEEDPNLNFSYAEKTSGEGASLTFNGDKNGSITTTKVIPNKEIEQEVITKTSLGERTSTMYWSFDESGNSTTVTWGLKGEHTLVDKAYQTIKGSNHDSLVHKMNIIGLNNLTEDVLKDMEKYAINVDGVTQYGGGYYMYTTSVAKQNELDSKTKPMMQEVMGFVNKNNLNMAGKPFTLYNQIDDANNTVIFSTGVPVKEQVITPEGSPVVCGFMEPVTTVKTTLKGDYKHLPETYLKARKYMEAQDLQIDPDRKMFEIYITDPEAVVNPANWVTEVYIPILSEKEPVEEEI